MLNALTLPPKLVLRALDDLHDLAQLARRAPAIEARAEGLALDIAGDLAGLREHEVAALLAAIAALDRRLAATERTVAAVAETVAPVAELPAVRADLHPLGDRLGDVRQATDDLEPMLADVARAIRELAPRVASIEAAVTPLRDVIDNLPRFMRQ